MMHRIAGRKLGRTTAHREAMLANLAASLVMHGRVETTLPKAKEVRHLAERVITLGKRGTLAARRRAISMIRCRKAVSKAFSELAALYAQRKGGYTRIMKLGQRHGDAAPMAVIEYVDLPVAVASGEKSAAKKAPKKPARKPAEKKAEYQAAATEPKAAAKKSTAKKPAAKKTPTRVKKSQGGE